MSINARNFLDKIVQAIVILLAFIVFLPLFYILYVVIKNGISVINWHFLTSLPGSPGEEGGILNSIVGTGLLVLIAALISVPVGILSGIFIFEHRGKISDALSVVVGSIQGTPSIVIGILGYLWVVKPMRHFSALSGGIALSIMMLPMVVKATEEALLRIPRDIIEASYALGAGYTRTILKVVLPSAMQGIISGILLAISRVAGETAPLLFTAFGNRFVNLNILKPVDALPLLIFNYSMSPYEAWHKMAYGAALVLIVVVLGINLITKEFIQRWKVQF